MNLTRERPFTIIVVNGRLFALTRKEVIMKSIGNEFWGMNEEEINRVTAKYPGYSIGRILSQERDCYRLITGKGEALARVSGKFRYSVESISDYPAVGDYVLVDHIDDIHDNEFAVIHVVLARKSVFLRKAAGTSRTEQVVAANIDTVFLCMALNKDYNLRWLERYLSIAWESGATAVVVLTKTDLCDDLEVIFTLLKKKINNRNDAVMYGIGHGGIEVWIVIFPVILMYLAVVLTGGKGMPAEVVSSIMPSIEAFGLGTAICFVIERIFCMGIHIALTLMVFYGVQNGEKKYLLKAVICHMILDVFPALYQRGVVGFMQTEIWLGVACVILCIFAYRLYQKL